MTVWIGTTGVKGGVQWWYSKVPVFWLPPGMFPGWMEWVVSFPKAPTGLSCDDFLILGSVSTMVFGMCATKVIWFVIGIIKDAVSWRKNGEVYEQASSEEEKPTFTGGKIVEITEEKDK